MKTVLTGELAEKRNRIMKSHNLRVIVLGCVTLFFPELVILISRSFGFSVPYPLSLMVVSFVVLVAGIVRIIKHDNQLCRESGFLCPFCQKPLYESRALIWNTLCPKCGKDIVDRHSA